MKNKLFYLISAACLLSYTGTFTSCVNGVDDEYLEQKTTNSTGSKDELPDLNGEYSMTGDYDLEMICNGELLEGQKVVMAVDENNESATITFTAVETDLESVIGLIPGANLIQGMGLKYTGNCPVPGEKELTFTNVPVYKNGSLYAFEGDLDKPTYTMKYKGKIVDDKMTLNFNYELKNQTLVGTWNLPMSNLLDPVNTPTNTSEMNPLWFDWDTNLKIKAGQIIIPGLGENGMNIDIYAPNELSQLLQLACYMVPLDVEQTIADLLQSITVMPNGSLYATYAWDSNTSNPDRWSSNMSHNIMRYYYDEENNEENKGRIYVEINGQFLLNTIKNLVQPSPNTRGAAEDLKALGTKLIEFLKPALENGIPCEYTLDGSKLSINIDGEFLLGALKLLAEVGNNEAAMGFLMPLLENDPTLAVYAPNLKIFLKRLPDLLTYHDESGSGALSGECKYVKIGLHLEK